MLKKLRLKFVIVNMLIVAVMLTVILGLTVQNTQAQLRSEREDALQNLALGVWEPGDKAVKMPHFVIMTGHYGKVTIAGDSYYDLNDEKFILELMRSVQQSKTPTGVIEKYSLQFLITQDVMPAKIVFVDVSTHNMMLNSLIRSSCIIGVVALAAFFVISLVLARWAVKPVEKAWQQQKQFVSDASHELKTPLAVIMSNAELLQNPEFDAENKERSAENILTVSKRMRGLVEGMLELARADNGQIRKSFEKLNVSQLLEDSLLPFEPMLFEKGLLLESEIDPDIMVNGNGSYLRQVPEILLDNAAKYSDKGAVRVQLKRQGRWHCLLTVSNPGEPIPQEELERIFDRFYRTDTAHSNNGSFGLGLPIAKSIVQEHGGKIWAISNHTGNCFCVLLPCVN